MKQLTKTDLLKLPHLSQVAFAVFCARQVIHLVKPKDQQVCLAAIAAAEGLLRGETTAVECLKAGAAADDAAIDAAAAANAAAADADAADADAYDAYAADASAYAAAAAYAAADAERENQVDALIMLIGDWE